MTFIVFIEILKSIPLALKIANEVWVYLMKVSNGRPEQLLKEIHSVMDELNHAKTEDERKLVARKISQLWGSDDKANHS